MTGLFFCTMIMKQHMDGYSAEDLAVWKTLFERQEVNLQDKVCPEYLEALKNMKSVLNADSIPDFRKIDDWFSDKTGWTIEVVPGLIPVEEFFALLAEKKFCSSTWLRTMKQLDYLEEPDMFHDIFGHVPLLSHPVFSDFMQQFGKLGCAISHDTEAVLALQRLYWFTIEFGLLQPENPLIYGAGIISSFGESNRAVSLDVNKLKFEMEIVTNKPFRTDVVQEEYVCVDSFDALFSAILQLKNEWSCAIG